VAIAYDRVVIRDLGSRNRVRVNGQVVDEARLQSGDELAIGPILFRLEQEMEKLETPPSTGRPEVARPGARLSSPTSNVYAETRAPQSPDDRPDSDLIPLDDL
jgi:pSer/pThr/pTyr-binding forkhead associated (FHA) protein